MSLLRRARLSALCCWLARRVRGPAGADPRAFELERRGDYAGAAAIYRAVLAARPADLAALLGLERCCCRSARAPRSCRRCGRALAAGPGARRLRHGPAGLGRGRPAGQHAGHRRAVGRGRAGRRDARIASGVPRRSAGRDRAGAIEAFQRGRERLGRPDALAAELAQLSAADGDYIASAASGCRRSAGSPGICPPRSARWRRPPSRCRTTCSVPCRTEREFLARRLEAQLLVRWGRPG